MKRVIFDTNIYGELVLDRDFERIKNAVAEKVVVHGFKIVRDELRAVPRKIKLGGRNLRISLLHIYDELTSKTYPLTPAIEHFGAAYYTSYRELGGSKPSTEIMSDFLIVACATFHEVDIVISEDNKSMLVENALKAYTLVNEKEKKRTPEFIGYLDFKRWLI